MTGAFNPDVRQRTGAPRGALKQELRTALKSLSIDAIASSSREVFWHDRSLQEIAEARGLSAKSTISERLSRILRDLRGLMGVPPVEATDAPGSFEQQMLKMTEWERQIHPTPRPPVRGYVLGRPPKGNRIGLTWGPRPGGAGSANLSIR